MADTTVSKEIPRCSMSCWFFCLLQSRALLMGILSPNVCVLSTLICCWIVLNTSTNAPCSSLRMPARTSSGKCLDHGPVRVAGLAHACRGEPASADKQQKRRTVHDVVPGSAIGKSPCQRGRYIGIHAVRVVPQSRHRRWDKTVSTVNWPPCGVNCSAMKTSSTSIVRTAAAPASHPPDGDRADAAGA